LVDIEAVAEERDIKQYGGYNPPRLNDAQANERAAEMVERFNKVFLRTLRALQGLRRLPRSGVVQNVRQVNIGKRKP
jgi:hypothetical protein